MLLRVLGHSAVAGLMTVLVSGGHLLHVGGWRSSTARLWAGSLEHGQFRKHALQVVKLNMLTLTSIGSCSTGMMTSDDRAK
jgi:hypothetical protein